MIAEISIVLSFLIGFSYQKYDYQEKYFDVLLDHFSTTDQRKFPIRYLINDKYWKSEDGPIFMYAGNEWDIIDLAQNTGFMWEAAEKLNALVVFAEHRYYGKSVPKIENMSEDDPKFISFLTIEQALADFVDILHELEKNKKSDGNQDEKNDKRLNPVILFGGSYGGELAIYMKMKYPDEMEGALASSAPILSHTESYSCESFNSITTKIFDGSGPHCVENIKNLWPLMRKKLSDDNGKTWMQENWNLCKPIRTHDDVTTILDLIKATLWAVATVNYPYPNDFLFPLPANPIKEMCSHLNTTLTDDKLLTAAFEGIISLYYNYKGDMKCFDWWKASPYGPSVGTNYWPVQVCTQMVTPDCSDGKSDMFEPNPFNFDEYSQWCYDTYNVVPNKKYIEDEYIKKYLKDVTNIIFSNGLLDPWHGGGILEKDKAMVSPSCIIKVLPDATHHLDLRASNPADPLSVKEARALYIDTFKKWIQEYHDKMKSS